MARAYIGFGGNIGDTTGDTVQCRIEALLDSWKSTNQERCTDAKTAADAPGGSCK